MSENAILQLTAPAAGDDLRLAALHSALVERACANSTIDVTYRLLDSPVGPLLLAATDRGVVRVAFAIEDHDKVLGSLGASLGSRILRGGNRLDPVGGGVDGFFRRPPRRLGVPLDLRLTGGFRLAVLRHLRE